MQRYDINGQHMWEASKGEFVRYQDAQAEIARLTAELQEARLQIITSVDKADAWDAISAKNEEIIRISAERDRQYDENVHRIAEQAKAEAERDAIAAATVEAMKDRLRKVVTFSRDAALIRDMDFTPADAKAALGRMLREARAEGMRAAAEIAAPRVKRWLEIEPPYDGTLDEAIDSVAGIEDAILARAEDMEASK